ncbi:hypothetical protein ACFIN9_18805 [Streptomyces noursei]|uniref:hypothetical protein n=1 Tax=Streptomyces noursei TaxID=1971 RepID=UPI0036D2BCC6
MKNIRRAAAVAGIAGAAVLGLGAPAWAAEGTWKVSVPGCNIYQQVQLQGSPAHDYMRWYTTGGSNGCEAWLFDGSPSGNTKGRQVISGNGSYYSSWYYDGPGSTWQVCARNGSGQMGCGPLN